MVYVFDRINASVNHIKKSSTFLDPDYSTRKIPLGNNAEVIDAFLNDAVARTYNHSLTVRRVVNRENAFDTLFLRSYNTTIAYKAANNDVVYYYQNLKYHPNGDPLKGEDLQRYRFLSSTTSQHLSKLFRIGYSDNPDGIVFEPAHNDPSMAGADRHIDDVFQFRPL
jgi:hypothetical protein